MGGCKRQADSRENTEQEELTHRGGQQNTKHPGVPGRSRGWSLPGPAQLGNVRRSASQRKRRIMRSPAAVFLNCSNTSPGLWMA